MDHTEFLRRREQLIQEDRAKRLDHRPTRNLSDIEHAADKIVTDIRAREAISVWGADPPVKPAYGSQQLFPGMEFLTARDTIVRTKIFAILSKMPKGSLLHAHLDATVDAKVLLRLALTQPAIHVRALERLTATNRRRVTPDFRGLPQDEWTGAESVTDPEYVPGTWVPIQSARSRFSEAFGGPEGFDRWVMEGITIDPSEAYGTHNSTKAIWEKFQSTFWVSGGLFRFVPIYTEYVREFLLSSIADGISFVEPRILFWYKHFIGADGQENVTHQELLRIFDQVMSEVKEQLKREGREDEFVGAKIIYTTLRVVTSEELEWFTEDCIALKKEFPHLIAGFDLVGHEDSLKPLIYYLDPLTKFVERQKEEGVQIPFLFHAGETVGDGTPADMNLYDAILLGTKRIGHGFSIVRHPKIMEICREKEICVEVCPISNEVLRLTGSMPMHPLPVMMNHGLHVALCSDDPSVFGAMGLSFDFFQALVVSEVTTLFTLGELARDSIKYSSMDDSERQEAMSKFERRWTQFLEWIVQEYGTAGTAEK